MKMDIAITQMAESNGARATKSLLDNRRFCLNKARHRGDWYADVMLQRWPGGPLCFGNRIADLPERVGLCIATGDRCIADQIFAHRFFEQSHRQFRGT